MNSLNLPCFMCAILVLISTCVPALASDLSVSVKPAKERFIIGEPIILVAQMTNNSEKVLEFKFSRDGLDAFDFESKQGTRSSRAASIGGLFPGADIKLDSHQSVERRLLLDCWLEQPPGKTHIDGMFKPVKDGIGFSFDVYIAQGSDEEVDALADRLIQNLEKPNPGEMRLWLESFKSACRKSEKIKRRIELKRQEAQGRRKKLLDDALKNVPLDIYD